ncbi:hypothetical protein PV939_11775, partial [Ligilactobacillus salivarius]|nr:hypothetical protein [Ligilactobacillus salivarius]
RGDGGVEGEDEGTGCGGRGDEGMSRVSSASAQVKVGGLEQGRYGARIDQLRQLQERFKPYTKM